MKRKFALYLASLLFFCVSSFAQKQLKLPEANQKVRDYALSVIGSQVGTGQCSDLIFNAQYVSQGAQSHTKWLKHKSPLPGDIISFIGPGGYAYHHAIIIEVTKDELTYAHQNHNGNLTVQTATISLDFAAGSSVHIERPLLGKIEIE